jgi:pre-mRNA-processing factor 6
MRPSAGCLPAALRPRLPTPCSYLCRSALLAKARENEAASGYPRVWMKSAIVERELGDTAKERMLLEEGVRRFPAFEKFYLMLGQLEQREGNPDGARVAYR